MAPRRKRKSARNDDNSNVEVGTSTIKEAANDSDGGDSDLNYEMRSVLPIRPRDAENIINVANKNPNIGRTQICYLFIEIAKRSDHANDFNIGEWLMKYYRKDKDDIPNFAEVALLISHAAQIYGRKVDWLYDFMNQINANTSKAIQLCEDTKQKAAEKEAEEETKPKANKKQRKKKDAAQADTTKYNPFGLFGGELSTKPSAMVSDPEDLKDKVQIELREKKNRNNFSYANVCHRLKWKLMALKIMRQMRRKSSAITKRPVLNCEFTIPCDNRDIINYADEEITDLDDDTLSTRRDFFVFMGMIRPEKHTVYLVNNFYCKEEERHSGTTLLPPEYVEKVYNVKLRNPKQYYAELQKELEIWEKLGPENHKERVKRCILIAYREAANIMNKRDFIGQMKESRIITNEQYNEAIKQLENPDRPIDSLDLSLSMPVELTKSSKDTSNCLINDTIRDNSFIPIKESTCTSVDLFYESDNDSVFKEKSGMELDVPIMPPPRLSPAEFVHKIINSELRVSVDEGICPGSGKSSPGLPRLCDLGPLERSILNPKVQLIDFCSPLSDADKLNLKFKVYEESSNIFHIDTNYITHSSDFVLPSYMLQPKVPLVMNFLKLPETKLRRRCDFALPMEYKEMRKRKSEFIVQLHCPRMPKMFKISELSLLKELDRAPSPELEEDDFCGFGNPDDEIFSSTPNTSQVFEDIESSHTTIISSPINLVKQLTGGPVLTGSPNPKQMRSFSQDSGYGCSQEIAPSDDDYSNHTTTLPSTTLPPIIEAPEIYEELLAINEKALATKTSNFLFEEEVELERRRQENEKCESEMVGRITDWYAHLAPILRASRERSFFDIHAYGREIIRTFTTCNRAELGIVRKTPTPPPDLSRISPPAAASQFISFSDILEDRPKDLTARYFLSVLQLANTENVEIIPPANRSRDKLIDVNDLKLKLLNPQIRHEAMDDSQVFECSEPVAKMRRIDHTQAPENPVDTIIKKCHVVEQKKDEQIGKIIEKCKVNKGFVDICRSYTADQLISIVGKLKNSEASEFGDSGFESVCSSLMSSSSFLMDSSNTSENQCR